jgi:hypothetical protein
MTFTFAVVLVICCDILWASLQEVAVGIAGGVWGDIQLVEIVPGPGLDGVIVGRPIAVARVAALPPGAVEPGALAEWTRVQQGRFVEV